MQGGNKLPLFQRTASIYIGASLKERGSRFIETKHEHETIIEKRKERYVTASTTHDSSEWSRQKTLCRPKPSRSDPGHSDL
jgi:hypothetical protein